MKKNNILLVAVVACLCATFAGLVYAACNSEDHPEGYELGVSVSGPAYVCIGETNTYSADVTWPFPGIPPHNTPIWSGGGSPTGGVGESFDTSWSTSGTNTLSVFVRGGDSNFPSINTVECTNMANYTVVSVEMDLITTNSTLEPTSWPVYICEGSKLTFYAKPNPMSTFPSGKPVWGGEASGAGVTNVDVTFTTPGTNYVTAECGNTYTAMVNVIKVDIEQAETNVCSKASSATLNLTSDSYWGTSSGSVIWTNIPTGLSNVVVSADYKTFTFNPSNSVPGEYEVKAYSSLLTNCTDTCTVRIIKVEMVPRKILNNEPNGDLPGSERLTRGAFVPLNDDDDDYSGSLDKDQTGPVTGETDLLPVVLRSIAPISAGGVYKLTIPDNVRIWLNSDRSGAVDDAAEFDATVDVMLYVEGVSNGDCIITANWQGQNMSLVGCGAVKISVFQFIGPLSVPALGTYKYQIEGTTGVWEQPINGTISPGVVVQEQERLIQWHRNPVRRGQTGYVRFSPSEHYTWGREVDIVHIRLAANDSEGQNNIAFRSSETGYEFTGIDWDHQFQAAPNAADAPVIRSSDGGPHIFRGWVQVLEIRGPTRSGVDHRGVDRLRFGFVQASRYIKKRSVYPGLTRASELEGNPVSLDRFLPVTEGLWIEDEAYNLANSSLTRRRSFFQPQTNHEIGPGNNHLVFHYEYRRGFSVAQDRPGLTISDRYEIGGEMPKAFEIDTKSYLYLCANTDSGNADADGRYYVLASPRSWWRFTAYGRIIDNSVLSPINASAEYANIGDMWGAYSHSVFEIRNNDNNPLKNIKELHDDLVETHLIVQEYPVLGDGDNELEDWGNE